MGYGVTGPGTGTSWVCLPNTLAFFLPWHHITLLVPWISQSTLCLCAFPHSNCSLYDAFLLVLLLPITFQTSDSHSRWPCNGLLSYDESSTSLSLDHLDDHHHHHEHDPTIYCLVLSTRLCPNCLKLMLFLNTGAVLWSISLRVLCLLRERKKLCLLSSLHGRRKLGKG